MKLSLRILAVSVALAPLPFIGAQSAAADVQIENPRRAHQNWILNCQGCHQPDARGSAGGAPNMAGIVAKFLSVEGGREFLIRVPGVASAPLDARQLADLVNWMLVTFDADNLPEGFVPYTEAEVAGLRGRPYIEEAAAIRSDLLGKMKAEGEK